MRDASHQNNPPEHPPQHKIPANPAKRAPIARSAGDANDLRILEALATARDYVGAARPMADDAMSVGVTLILKGANYLRQSYNEDDLARARVRAAQYVGRNASETTVHIAAIDLLVSVSGVEGK